MLCPEVWDFKAPQHYFEIQESSCQKQEVSLKIIPNHYYNHSVSLVLPESNDVPEHLHEAIIEDSDYYKVEDLSVCDLIDKEFIEAFIKKGEVTLLSIDVRIDLENCIAITPTGQLLLSLTTEDYQKLGLEGKPSVFDRKLSTRYLVTIDLKEETFTPGKKKYERVKKCLTENLHQKFNVIFAWEPPDEKLCPSSIAAWFHNRTYKVFLCKENFIKRVSTSLSIPLIENNYDTNKFIEWIGVFSIDGDTESGNEDNFLNKYTCPLPKRSVGQVLYVEYTGFFTRLRAAKVFNIVRDFIKSGSTPAPWGSLHIHGFADSPVSWGLKEHTFYTDGDNSYTIIFQPNGEYIIQKSLSSNNKPRIFQ
ncbi:ribonuclease P protein subunit p40-like [Chelonus insularis]|uniref:ribonuclease P protein subunit p40-like n=1 Tax=Chelonus insularis TaxID=460826 RepID=UPI00158E042B|nr:ribonuclease P protein subunit p40-like [Chelonus insularis]